MTELVEEVARAQRSESERDEPMHPWELELARAAIEAVFDAMAEPSSEATTQGGYTQIPAHCDECPCYEYDIGDYHAKEVWTAMLATLRKQALG